MLVAPDIRNLAIGSSLYIRYNMAADAVQQFHQAFYNRAKCLTDNVRLRLHENIDTGGYFYISEILKPWCTL